VCNFCFCYRALLGLYFEMGRVFICNITVNCTLYVLVQSEDCTYVPQQKCNQKRLRFFDQRRTRILMLRQHTQHTHCCFPKAGEPTRSYVGPRLPTGNV
jgi:hypothetical protein